jgi:hypothetical protein
MTILNVPVTKGKGTVSVDTDTAPENYYKAALEQGFKVIVNGGASKIVAPSDKTDEAAMAKYHEAAMAKAQERVAAMMAGTLKLGRASASKGPSGEVMTEARRLARNLVKDAMKAAGLRVSHYKASEITEAANQMLADTSPSDDNPKGLGPWLIEQATSNIEKRKEKPASAAIISAMKADPALVAKAEAEKAAKKTNKVPLSALQAGKVAPRASSVMH